MTIAVSIDHEVTIEDRDRARIEIGPNDRSSIQYPFGLVMHSLSHAGLDKFDSY